MIDYLGALAALGIALLIGFGLILALEFISRWAARTPRSGWLILSVFVLFILVRSLP